MATPSSSPSNESTAVVLARLEERLKSLSEKVEEIDDKLSNKYITTTEFEPIKRVVYGWITVVLTAITVGLVALVVKPNTTSAAPTHQQQQSSNTSLKNN